MNFRDIGLYHSIRMCLTQHFAHTYTSCVPELGRVDSSREKRRVCFYSIILGRTQFSHRAHSIMGLNTATISKLSHLQHRALSSEHRVRVDRSPNI